MLYDYSATPLLNVTQKEIFMGFLPIVSKKSICKKPYIGDKLLPPFYMGDFSLMGLRVDKLQKARQILMDNGIRVVEKGGDYTAATDDRSRAGDIIQLLRDHGVECGLTDLVTQVYQG